MPPGEAAAISAICFKLWPQCGSHESGFHTVPIPEACMDTYGLQRAGEKVRRLAKTVGSSRVCTVRRPSDITHKVDEIGRFARLRNNISTSRAAEASGAKIADGDYGEVTITEEAASYIDCGRHVGKHLSCQCLACAPIKQVSIYLERDPAGRRNSRIPAVLNRFADQQRKAVGTRTAELVRHALRCGAPSGRKQLRLQVQWCRHRKLQQAPHGCGRASLAAAALQKMRQGLWCSEHPKRRTEVLAD
ncbi:hypothetical protein D3C87_1341910 [compost metagenome]